MTIKRITRRNALRLGAAGGVATAALASRPTLLRAQEYPTRPINVVIPFETGGYNDRLARAFAPFLQQELGQPVVIVNRPGAGTMLGNMFFLQQADDGYTIMCTSSTPYIPLTILLQNAPYKAEDFWMLNLPSRDYTLAATATEKPIESFAQVIDQLKENPGALSLGVQPASADYVNLMLALDAAGIDPAAARIVTYDGGGPARTATAGAHVDVGFVGGEGFLPLKDRIRPLLVFANERMEGFEDTPAAAEFATERGLEMEYVDGSQRGWVVHSTFREKHADRYQFLLDALERATTNPEAVQALLAQQLATRWYGPEESNQAYLETFTTLERHAQLLKGA